MNTIGLTVSSTQETSGIFFPSLDELQPFLTSACRTFVNVNETERRAAEREKKPPVGLDFNQVRRLVTEPVTGWILPTWTHLKTSSFQVLGFRKFALVKHLLNLRGCLWVVWIQTSAVKRCWFQFVGRLLCVCRGGSEATQATKSDKENLYWQFLIQIVVGHHRNIDIVHIYTVNIKKNDPILFRLQYKWIDDAWCWWIKWPSRGCLRKKKQTVVHVWLKWAVCAKHTEAEQNS